MTTVIRKFKIKGLLFWFSLRGCRDDCAFVGTLRQQPVENCEQSNSLHSEQELIWGDVLFAA